MKIYYKRKGAEVCELWVFVFLFTFQLFFDATMLKNLVYSDFMFNFAAK